MIWKDSLPPFRNFVFVKIVFGFPHLLRDKNIIGVCKKGIKRDFLQLSIINYRLLDQIRRFAIINNRSWDQIGCFCNYRWKLYLPMCQHTGSHALWGGCAAESRYYKRKVPEAFFLDFCEKNVRQWKCVTALLWNAINSDLGLSRAILISKSHTSWVWAAQPVPIIGEKKQRYRPQSPRSKTTRLLRSRSYTASCWLRTKHQEKTLPVSAEPPCTPFIPRKETGNGLVRACTHTKCCFCRDLQKCIQIIVPCAHAQCTPCKNTMHTGCL